MVATSKNKSKNKIVKSSVCNGRFN